MTTWRAQLITTAAAQPTVFQPPRTAAGYLGPRVWSGKGLIALLDQGFISGSNFLISLLLARSLTPERYGAYALAFEVFLFFSIFYGCVILEPMSVFGSSDYGQLHRDYLGALLRIHVIISALMGLLTLAGAFVMHTLRSQNELFSALIAVGVAIPSVQLFELTRRAFYIKLSAKDALIGSSLYLAILLCGLVVLYSGQWLSPLSAFLLMAAGAICTSLRMLHILKPRWISAQAGHEFGWRQILRVHWAYGRWALGSAVAIWFAGAICYGFLGRFRGLAELGKMKALMNFSSPIGQVFAALSLLSLPYASRIHHQEGLEGIRRLAWRLAALYVGGTLLYWAVVLPLGGPITQHLYNGKYSQITGILFWAALASVFRISATTQAIMLRAMQSPASVFWAYSAACAVSLVVGIPLTLAYGLKGAMLTLVLSSATAFVTGCMMVRFRSAPRFASGSFQCATSNPSS